MPNGEVVFARALTAQLHIGSRFRSPGTRPGVEPGCSVVAISCAVANSHTLRLLDFSRSKNDERSAKNTLIIYWMRRTTVVGGLIDRKRDLKKAGTHVVCATSRERDGLHRDGLLHGRDVAINSRKADNNRLIVQVER